MQYKLKYNILDRSLLLLLVTQNRKMIFGVQAYFNPTKRYEKSFQRPIQIHPPPKPKYLASSSNRYNDRNKKSLVDIILLYSRDSI